MHLRFWYIHLEQFLSKWALCLGTTRSAKPQKFHDVGLIQWKYASIFTSADAFNLCPLCYITDLFRRFMQYSQIWCPECRFMSLDDLFIYFTDTEIEWSGPAQVVMELAGPSLGCTISYHKLSDSVAGHTSGLVCLEQKYHLQDSFQHTTCAVTPAQVGRSIQVVAISGRVSFQYSCFQGQQPSSEAKSR